MALTKNKVIDLYRRRSSNYDFTANLYYLIGFRETKYRKQAVSELGVKLGDSVVEVGCGTGLNFKYVINFIGETGNLIGIDLTDAMLKKASDRVLKNNWTNVKLVQCDAAEYNFTSGVSAVFSTLALTMVPEYEKVIERAAHALKPDGKFVIFDLKRPNSIPLWLVKLGIFFVKPFGVSLDLADRKPWITMNKYFSNI